MADVLAVAVVVALTVWTLKGVVFVTVCTAVVKCLVNAAALAWAPAPVVFELFPVTVVTVLNIAVGLCFDDDSVTALADAAVAGTARSSSHCPVF